MSNVPADLHYTKDHEWIKVAADGTAVIGITDHAQAALGDVTFVDLPKVGASFNHGDVFGTVNPSRPPPTSTAPSPAKSSRLTPT